MRRGTLLTYNQYTNSTPLHSTCLTTTLVNKENVDNKLPVTRFYFRLDFFVWIIDCEAVRCPIKLFLSLCDLFLAHDWHFKTNICIKVDYNCIVCFVWSVHSPSMNPRLQYESDFENNFSFNYFTNIFLPLLSKTIFLNYFLRLWEVSALVLCTLR